MNGRPLSLSLSVDLLNTSLISLLLSLFLDSFSLQGFVPAIDSFGRDAEAVVMLDADGSHPVEAIPEMIEHFLAGARVVQCQRRSIGGRSGWRNAGSALFDRLTRWLTGVDMAAQNIYFRLVSAETAREDLHFATLLNGPPAAALAGLSFSRPADCWS